MVLALAALPILVIIVQAILWRRELCLRATPEWRKEREFAFWTGPDLPSPCRRFDHVIVDGACRFCEDLQYYAAEWWDDLDFIMMSSQHYNKDDPRILRLIAVNSRRGTTHRSGYAIVDPERRAKVDKYHRHARELPARSLGPTVVLALSFKNGNKASKEAPQGGSRGPQRSSAGGTLAHRGREARLARYNAIIGKAPSHR